MHAEQSTPVASSEEESFRWSRAEIFNALETFSHSDASSQRQFAEQEGIPHATFNYWQRQFAAAADDPIDSFFCSTPGDLVLRRIVTAALVTFQQRGACGIRLIGDFLELAQLDRFVATSRGALHPLAAHLEADLVAFRDQEQPLLVGQMPFRTMTLIVDEHFHCVKPCLVAIEPVSGFIVVECYRDNRNADTWTKTIQEGTAGMHVDVVLLCSDLAKALLCCAEKGLEVAHSPDLFHGQRDLLKPLLLPLNRPIQQAEKDLENAKRRGDKLDTPIDTPQSAEELLALIEVTRQEAIISERLQEAKKRKEAAVQEVRGIGDDYHPFDRKTGKPVMAEEVGKRLAGHLDELEEVVQKAELGSRAQEAVNKARTWVGSLVGCVAWFWCLTDDRIEELDLSEEQERVVKEKLLPGHYWAMAAGRARTPEERERLKEMAEALMKEAWQKGGPLASLSEEEKRQVNEVARERAGLFQRSSSCVEGRNGRLSLQHHGHNRVSERRLKAQTVIHNYVIHRADGTTAAERFFGQKHKDVFSWLLDRMPDLPRPAPKRPNPVGVGFPMAV
jgi:hypothetical protein